MSLKSQRRLAADMLKVGQNRVWLDPERVVDIEAAITREEVRRLIHEKAIRRLSVEGVSRSRVRVRHAKLKRGLRRGHGKRSKRRISKKTAWMMRIRALRRRLRWLKEKRVITEKTYRRFYNMAGSGAFDSISEIERRLKATRVWRTR